MVAMDVHGIYPRVEVVAVLLCEGPACNGGRSAQERERDASTVRGVLDPWGSVSRDLTYTTHVRSWRNQYACRVCGHQRVYGAGW